MKDLHAHIQGDNGQKMPHPLWRYCGAIFNTKKEFESHTKTFHYLWEVCYDKGEDEGKCIFGNSVSFKHHIDEKHSHINEINSDDIDRISEIFSSKLFLMKPLSRASFDSNPAIKLLISRPFESEFRM